MRPWIFAGLWISTAIAHIAQAPLQIDAANGMTYVQETHTCSASGGVRITQGAFSLSCDEMTAQMRERDHGVPEIYAVQAQGHVQFQGRDKSQATGAQATYDLDTRTLTLSGDPILTHGDMVMRAARFQMTLTSEGAIAQVSAHGHSRLDSQGPGMLKQNQKNAQTQALIVPPAQDIKDR